MPIFTTITELDAAADIIRHGRYGVIETAAGKLVAIHLRPWPKLISWRELWPVGRRYHVRGQVDRCWLYYNQPLRYSNFLSLKYVASTEETPYRTCLAALSTLDTIAQIKGTDALLCDVANSRISDRLLTRLGWEAHKHQRWHRNFIKRFYGEYS